jgi:hypothetical protein
MQYHGRTRNRLKGVRADTVRVSAELIDAAQGTTQWSERHDRPYKSIFALQDEITRAVTGALGWPHATDEIFTLAKLLLTCRNSESGCIIGRCTR